MFSTPWTGGVELDDYDSYYEFSAPDDQPSHQHDIDFVPTSGENDYEEELQQGDYNAFTDGST